jgi:hypothetical protein
MKNITCVFVKYNFYCDSFDGIKNEGRPRWFIASSGLSSVKRDIYGGAEKINDLALLLFKA